MDRGDAYNLLAARLNDLRALGYEALLERVGQSAHSEIVQVNNEPIQIEITVSWADRQRARLSVRAAALGPSNWLTQRLDESIVIKPGTPAAR